MALTINWAAKVIDSDSSITDLPAFHAELRDAEDSAEGMLHPTTHRWRALDLGGGAFFYAADLINGWRLRFPAPGTYTIQGNLGGEIIPVAGVYVERKTSAAYATTAVGGSGPSASDIAAALLAALAGDLARLRELHLIHGLSLGSPLVVTPTQREAGDVVQAIDESGSTVTVTRTP